MPNARFLLCLEGNHLAMYDDQQTYVTGPVRFILDVDRGVALK